MGTDLKRDLQTRGCPVCDHLEDALFAYFSRLQFDLTHDEDTRKTFADECGLCRFHTWQLAAFSSARGLAKGLPPLLSCIANELLRIADRGHEGDVEQTVSGEWSADCRVCALLRKEEEAYATRLIEFLDCAEGRSIYGTSQGVCLRHLGLLVKSVPHETARFLMRHAAGRLREMETHLKSYDQKLESGTRHDCLPEEKNADRCALIHIASAKYLSFPLK
jgi:hypothetical protein